MDFFFAGRPRVRFKFLQDHRQKHDQHLPAKLKTSVFACTLSCHSHPLSSQMIILNDNEYDMNIEHIYICICVGFILVRQILVFFLARTSIQRVF